MLPFTRVMNLYLIGFFSIAAIGVVLTLGVGIVEVIRYRRLHLAQAAMPTGDLGSGLDRKGDVGERRELNTWAAGSIVRFESRIVIQRPISQTFERLADLPGYAGWMHRDGLFRRSGLPSELPVRTGDDLFRLDVDGDLRGGGDRVRAADANRVSRESALVRIPAHPGSARVLPGRRRDRNDRSPRCRWRALRLDEIHEAGRSMDGESRADPHSELPETFPGVRLIERWVMSLATRTQTDLRCARWRSLLTAGAGPVKDRPLCAG